MVYARGHSPSHMVTKKNYKRIQIMGRPKWMVPKVRKKRNQSNRVEHMSMNVLCQLARFQLVSQSHNIIFIEFTIFHGDNYKWKHQRWKQIISKNWPSSLRYRLGSKYSLNIGQNFWIKSNSFIESQRLISFEWIFLNQ